MFLTPSVVCRGKLEGFPPLYCGVQFPVLSQTWATSYLAVFAVQDFSEQMVIFEEAAKDGECIGNCFGVFSTSRPSPSHGVVSDVYCYSSSYRGCRGLAGKKGHLECQFVV